MGAGARPSRNGRATPLPPAQTLYVLSLVGFTAERPPIKRGIDCPGRHAKAGRQLADAFSLDPDGSPGSSKLLTPITCAASSWATLGLARLVPKEKPASKADADRNAQKTLLAQILSMDGSVDRAALIAKLADRDLQSKMTALLPEIERAFKVRRSTLALEAEIKEIGGKLSCTPSGPQWLYLATGNTAMEIFDIPTTIDLLQRQQSPEGQRGTQRTGDRCMACKRLSGRQHTPKTRPGEPVPFKAMACGTSRR